MVYTLRSLFFSFACISFVCIVYFFGISSASTKYLAGTFNTNLGVCVCVCVCGGGGGYPPVDFPLIT